MREEIILYVGGFQLPDRNAAALRVMANAKALRLLGHQVIFLNALQETKLKEPRWTQYEEFRVYEYEREPQSKYLLGKKKIVKLIKECNVTCVIAYNHPACALNSLRRYCKRNRIRCIADATEWYVPKGSIIFRLIKGLDSEIRMRYVHPKMDGVIAISQYLYDYYKKKVLTIKVPPLVDITEKKWKYDGNKKGGTIEFIYAGSPSAQKERLDLIVKTVEELNVKKEIHLNIVGITEEQYNNMYQTVYKGKRTTFWGRLTNSKTIEMVKDADWAIILRENNKVVKAGFPTKLVESITCGTPVIINRFSNVEEYLVNENAIIIEDASELSNGISASIGRKMLVEPEVFDYRRYTSMFNALFYNCKEINKNL